MTEEEYLRALIAGVQRMFERAEDELTHARSTDELRRAIDAQRDEGVAFLGSLEPPVELLDLHARLVRQAGRRRDALASGAGDLSDMLELARRAERYGLQLVPGLTAQRIEEIAAETFAGGTPVIDGRGIDDSMALAETGEPGWELRMRRILALNNHPEPDAVIEHLRGLRE